MKTHIFFILFFLSFSCNAQVMYVDSSIAVSGDGSSWVNAYKELREAMTVIRTNTSITELHIAKGTYRPTNNANLDSSFCIYRGNIKLYGGYPSGGGTRDINANPVLLTGQLESGSNQSFHVMIIAGLPSNADSVVLDGITITKGKALIGGYVRVYNGQSIDGNSGSGLYLKANLSGNRISIRNCVFTGNSANTGAGVYNRSSGSPVFNNCIFSYNIGYGSLSAGVNSYGAGLYNYQSSATLNNCSFSNNTFNRSGYGIGMYNELSTVAINNCGFYNNIGGSDGAGIANYNASSVIINNSVFNNNSSTLGVASQGNGGAIRNVSSNINIDQCMFFRNIASTTGAAISIISAPSATISNISFVRNIGGTIHIFSCAPIISNCTFIKDTCNRGGGIYNQAGAAPLVSNSTFFGNFGQSTASAGVGIFCADSSGGIYKNCIFWGNRAANNFFPGQYEFYSANDGSHPLKPRPVVSYSILQEPFPILNVTDSGNNSMAYPLFTDSVATEGPDGLYATADDGLRLQLCSPGIDAGLNIAIPGGISSDITGGSRIRNNSVDLGAYENYSPAFTGTTTIANDGDSAFKSINGLLHVMADCRLICTIEPTGVAALRNGILAKIAIDPLTTTFNKPYVKRYYDITPSENAGTATAAITLYFLQTDFDAFNLARGVYPSMPVDATDAANYKGNIVVHQFHAATGVEEILIPSSVTWNSANNWWEVSFSVTGFSRFYLSTVAGPLPVQLEYFTGQKQDENILLTWKARCFDSPFSTFVLEKSSNGITFDKIFSIQPGEQRCQQPFNYTDINPKTPEKYYRLKITDADEKVTYSKILFFSNSLKNEITVSPTLLKTGSLLNVVVQLKGNTLSIYNSNGKLIQKNILAEGVNRVMVNSAAGVYFYRITNANQPDKKSGMIIIQ